MPMFSKVHMKYGTSAFMAHDLFKNPVVGWIAGASPKAKIVNGQTGEISDSLAVAMHCRLPENMKAHIEIVSPFSQGDGDTFMFSDYLFDVKECQINGKLENMYDYWKRNYIDTKLPLVANISGALINVNIGSFDDINRITNLSAAVIPGVKYKIAKPLPDYAKAFKTNIPTKTDSIVSTINCHANFEYLKLEGQKLGDLTGPFAFGEIAYLLLNQTTVNLYIEDADKK